MQVLGAALEFDLDGRVSDVEALGQPPFHVGCDAFRLPATRTWCNPGATMVYAIFMLLVLATLAAAWFRPALQLPLFIVTVAGMLVHLLLDMTTPLTLSF